MILFAIIIAAFVEAAASFSGAFLTLFHESFARTLAHRVLGFAIGALLGVSFFEIIPEAASEVGLEQASIWVVAGILVFFIIEKFVRWYHHHEGVEDTVRPFAALVLLGDAIHNFIDGVVLALAFLVSVPLGVATTIAVVLHEIPQEVSDLAVLIRAGYPRIFALRANFFISLTTLVGAAVGYVFGTRLEMLLPYALALVSGNFLYIAMSDLIPETHEESGAWHALVQIALLIAGAVTMYFVA